MIAIFSKQLPHIHRKEIFRADATITYNKRRLLIEKFAEFIQPVRPFSALLFTSMATTEPFLRKTKSTSSSRSRQ